MVKKHISELCDLNIIRSSSSVYAAPAFTKLNPNGSIRLLIDYRGLNDITYKEAYPFPNIKDQISDLREAKVFSQIDLDKGYYQIKIKNSNIFKNSFHAPFWSIRIFKNAFWSDKCTPCIPKSNDKGFIRS